MLQRLATPSRNDIPDPVTFTVVANFHDLPLLLRIDEGNASTQHCAERVSADYRRPQRITKLQSRE